MNVEELLNKQFKDVLEEYCILYSPECDYGYGIASWDDVEKLYDKYDISDEPSIFAKSLLDYHALNEFDNEGEVLTFEKLEEILRIIGLDDKLKGVEENE